MNNEEIIREKLDTRVQFRMSNRLAQELKVVAKENGVILSTQIRNILKESLK